MVETVMILPVLMVVFVLIVFLGWNIRRLEKTTQMDRYEAWRAAMPGTPGPARNDQDEHANMNQAFFTADSNDTARSLNANVTINRRQYEAHDLLLTQLTEEDFAYYQDFIDEHPATVYVRFEAEHEPFSPLLETIGMSEATRNRTGFRVRNGDWRFADGIRFDGSEQQWVPGARRITPNPALINVFYAQFDEELQPLADGSNNPLASAARNLYRNYPGYRGPEVLRNGMTVGSTP